MRLRLLALAGGNLLAAVLVLVYLRGPKQQRWIEIVIVLGGVCGLAVALRTIRSSAPARKLLRRISAGVALAVVTLLITLVAGEAFVRITDLGGIAYYDQSRAYHDEATEPDPESRMRYRHKAGFRGRFGAMELVVNSRGLRDPERSLPKPPGTRRWIILGDSVVFGWGVPLDQTFPQLLERDLSAAGSERFEVINAGVCSYDTRDEAAWFAHAGLRYEPDLILLVFVPNDANTITDDRRAAASPFAYREEIAGVEGVVIGLLGRSRMAQLLYQRLGGGLARDFRADRFTPDSPHWQECRRWLERVRQLCAQRKIPFVLAGLFNGHGLRGDRARQRLEEYARTSGLKFLNCDEFFRSEDYRRFVNTRSDPHWNAAGHRRVADRILRELRNSNVLTKSGASH